MHGHPAYRQKNIEAQRCAGVDPKIGEWPGDPGYKPGRGLKTQVLERGKPPRDATPNELGYEPPASEGELSERFDPSPSEAVRVAAARSVVEEFVKVAVAAQSAQELERVASECNDVSRLTGLDHNLVLREIAATIHASVQTLNLFIAEAARRGVSVEIKNKFLDLPGAQARAIKLSVKLRKIL